MRTVLKVSALAILLSLASCAHHGYGHDCGDKKQCQMKDGKKCGGDKEQCPMQKGEEKTEEVKK